MPTFQRPELSPGAPPNAKGDEMLFLTGQQLPHNGSALRKESMAFAGHSRKCFPQTDWGPWTPEFYGGQSLRSQQAPSVDRDLEEDLTL